MRTLNSSFSKFIIRGEIVEKKHSPRQGYYVLVNTGKHNVRVDILRQDKDMWQLLVVGDVVYTMYGYISMGAREGSRHNLYVELVLTKYKVG